MLETCPRCGVQYLPKAGEPGCPQCKPAETGSELDEGWGDLEDVPTPAPPPLQMAPPPPKPEEEVIVRKKVEESAAPQEEPEEATQEPPAKVAEATISPGKFEPEITTGQVQRPRKTRARGKKSGQGRRNAEGRGKAQGPQPAPPPQAAAKRKPPQAQAADKKPARRKLPAWLIPVAVLLACLAVLALALIASKSKGQ